MVRIVWQIVRRITNETLGVKGLRIIAWICMFYMLYTYIVLNTFK